jgi:hypothetical protein
MGVPLGNCFLNKMEWFAEAVDVNSTHLKITTHTEFIVPVLGVLRSKIERESYKGIKYSYGIFEDVLNQQQWNTSSSSSGGGGGSTTSSTITAAGNLSSGSSMVGNLNKSTAMSTAKFQKEEGDSSGISLATKTAALLEEGEEIGKGDAFIAEVEEEVESDQDEEPLQTSKKPHKQAYYHYRGKSFDEIKKIATEKWPAWADNRYWLLKSGSHGGSEVVSSCPTPDEAVGMMWAVVGYVSNKKHGSPLRAIVSRDAFVKGLVECFRVSKARTPPKGAIRVLRGGGGNAAGGRGGGRGGKGRGGKNNKTAVTAAAAATTAAAVSNALAPVLSPSSISSAIFCIGYVESDCEWSKEIDDLCALIPVAEFTKVIEVYNVIWSLRSSRHWTPHLPLLEAAVVNLLTNLEEEEWTTRQMRHASYCAQGLVHFGHVPKELMTFLTPRVLEHWDWRAVCSFAWALTISNQLDSPLVPEIFKGIQIHAEEALQTGLHKHTTLSKIWQLVASLNRMRPGSFSRKSWNEGTKKLIEKAQAEWEELVNEDTKITSGVQKDVYRSMISMGYDADLECAVVGLSIDVAVQDIKLAVEVDGFGHFARNKPNQAVGNSLWKKRFLEANGWMAVNVNVKDWCNKRGAAEKREFLKEAIEQEEERKKLKDAARLKRKKYWRTSFPRSRTTARRKKAAAKSAAAAAASTVAATP